METQAKHTPTPWKCEWRPTEGYSEGTITAAGDQSQLLAIVCGSNYCFFVDDEDCGESEAKANAEFIVKACNSYEKFIELAHMVAGKMYDDGVGRGAVQLAEELLDGMGIQRWNGPNLQSTCKPLTS